MSRFLRVNTILTDQSGERVVLGIDPSLDRVELFVRATQTVQSYSLRTLRKELAIGTVTSNSPETVKGTVRDISESSASFDAFQFNKALSLKINAMMAQGKSKASAIKSLLNTSIELASGKVLPMCSERQAYRILKLAASSNAALIPGYVTRGNRTPRYPGRIIEIILQQVENLYAVEASKITLSKLTELVNEAAHTEGILKENKNVMRKFVLSVLIKHWNADLDTGRLNPRLAKSLKAVAANRIRPGAPLNRVEMDGLHLPFLARTENGIADNLWVLLVIDCETSLPLGWWLMLTNPTTEDTLHCLERAIYPKAELLCKMGINYEVDPYGTMLNLVWDNGGENSRHRMAAVAEVGINPQWTPVSSGNMKPFIERLNRSIKVALEGLPGSTRFNGKDGTRTEAARNDPLMTVAEFEHWLVRFLFEKWPHVPLERFNNEDYELDGSLGLTPAERWRNYEARTLLPLSPPIEDWRALRFTTVPRALSSKTGISLHNYDFKGNNLALLIQQYGPTTVVPVHYNPFDYRTAYVPDKSTGDWLVLVNAEVTDKTPAYSFEEAKKNRKRRKVAHPQNPIAQKFDSDINEKIVSPALKKPSRAANRKQAHAITRLGQAVQRGLDTPLPQPQDVQLPLDTYIADDAIPTFNTHHKLPCKTR
jgi:putative transposase